MQTVLKVLGQEIVVDCDPSQQRRLQDLASALDARLAATSGDPVRRLALTAIALLDEAQATGAALARARCVIERLSDMVVEARLEADSLDVDLDRPASALHAAGLS